MLDPLSRLPTLDEVKKMGRQDVLDLLGVGLNALTRGIARQHANDGIRAVTIAPGAVQTPMLEVSKKKLGEGIVAPRPGVVKPVATPEEVAALAAFLASDDASYISGAIYTIDGGASGY